MEGIIITLFEFLWALFVFISAICSLPVLFLIYLVAKFLGTVFVTCVSLLNPDLELIKRNTFRILLDTHRNQGIIPILLTIKGEIKPDAVQRHLQELIHRKDKHGNLAFPRLRQNLVTKCGYYAWQTEQVSLEQNLVLAPYIYRGRSVSSLNIQDCVSEIISKYLPSGIPPWQVVMIPSSEDHHYILVRIHHILLSEGLNIADLLPLIPPLKSMSDTSSETKSPLRDVLLKPKNLPFLKERLAEDFTNYWNEFISNYDPLEQPELFKKTPGIFQFFAITLITAVSSLKEIRKGLAMIKPDIFSRTKFVSSTISRECWKRKVSLSNFIRSIFVSLNPINMIKLALKNWLKIIKIIVIRIPIMINYEIMAFLSCVFRHYCPYPNTFVGTIYSYVPLLYFSMKEVFHYCKLIFYTPAIVVKTMTARYKTMQTVTVCGRKVLTWSKPVDIEFISKIAKKTELSPTEISMSAFSSTLSKYLGHTQTVSLNQLPITCRNINFNYIVSTGTNVKPEDSVGGMVYFNIPILNSDKPQNLIENLKQINANFDQTKQFQGMTYLLTILENKFGILSRLFPGTFMNILLKYMSAKYSVMVTEVTSRQPNVTQTIWGQEVLSILYWRPPQANITISACLNQYAGKIILGVICDAQLVPNHTLISDGFQEYFEDLAAAVGVTNM